MRILIIGFIVFVGWSALSTYIYVCKIKGLCNQQNISLVELTNPNETITNENKESEKEVEKEIEKAKKPSDLETYFAFDKSDFRTGADASKFYEESNAYILQNTQAKLKIIGHTDAIGSVEYNYALGLRRAQSMLDYFESKGIPSNRISIESKGEKEPKSDNTSDEGRANNRRTVVTIK
jgi:peptidoglycan-associated lipoprotein